MQNIYRILEIAGFMRHFEYKKGKADHWFRVSATKKNKNCDVSQFSHSNLAYTCGLLYKPLTNKGLAHFV
jgi:hypothetical protein